METDCQGYPWENVGFEAATRIAVSLGGNIRSQEYA